MVDQETEQSKLQQSTDAEGEADTNIEIQGCHTGDTWEILLGIGTQCGHGEYRGDPCESTRVEVGQLLITLLKEPLRRRSCAQIDVYLTHLPKEVLA